MLTDNPTESLAAGVRLIDVSQYQGNVDWAKVKAAGIAGAFIRSGQGGKFIDTKFEVNWWAAQSAGILVAPYHVVLPNQTEEDHWALLTALMKMKTADLPWALDVEVGGGTTASRSTLIWNLCKRLTGIMDGHLPVIYTGGWFWNPNLEVRDWKSVADLWLASYTANAPAPLKGWSKWHLWQYTSSQRLAGITANTVDMDAWYGTQADLDAWRLPHGEPPDPPLPPTPGLHEWTIQVANAELPDPRKWIIRVVDGELAFVKVE